MSAPAVALARAGVAVHDATLLQDLNFTLPPGAYLAVVGPNGAGKTTLLKLLLGLVRPTSGTVAIFGGAPGRGHAAQTGYVPQTKTVDRSFPATARELVVSGIRARWPARPSVADRTAAGEAMARCGVEHVAERPLRVLSGGELQRVFLARCLVRHPALILLDEPAAGMDIEAEAAMYHLLADYQQDTQATVVMVTHDWEGARVHASHALLLNRTQVAFGPAAEVAQPERLMAGFGFSGHVKASHPAPSQR